MRSIPAAMTWELLTRDRWALPSTALGALALPVVLLALLGQEGVLDPQARHMLVMHLMLLQMNICAFGGVLVINGWKLSTLYAMPATAATLVLWRLVPAMTLMFVETVVWTAVLNALFGLDWPLWWPALLAATAVAAVSAAVWIAERSRWLVLSLVIAGGALGLAIKARYGASLSSSTPTWPAVTSLEIVALFALVAASFAVATRGVARNRRGEAPFSTGLMAWIEQALDPTPAPRPPFRSAGHAQFWFVWNKGWVMPMIACVVMTICLIIWLFAGSNAGELVEGAWILSRFMPVIALIGATAMGNAGTSTDYVMGHFMATRPVTSAHFARLTLRAGAASLLLAWTMWMAAIAVVYAALAIFGEAPATLVPPNLDWRELPASFLGSWAVFGVWGSALLTGRSKPFLRLLAQLSAAYIGLMVLGRLAMTPPARELMLQIAIGVLGVALIGVTGWLFAAAWRREHIDGRTAAWAFAIWLLLIAAGAMLFPMSAEIPKSTYVLVTGLLALVVAPAAAAPLAVAWNRTR